MNIILFSLIVMMGLGATFAKSKFGKGMIGEFLVNRELKKLAGQGYLLYKDVLLVSENDSTQIDHILVSDNGIFILETKNFQGEIYGKKREGKWTQKVHGRSFTFQNPLRQNYKHILFLANRTELEQSKIHSIVVFAGTAKLKSSKIENVLKLNEINSYILSAPKTTLSEEETDRVIRTIHSAKSEDSFLQRLKHNRRIKRRLNF